MTQKRGGRRLVQILKTGATLLASVAIVVGIWQRIGPRMERLPAKAVTPKALDVAFQRLTPREIAVLPLATRFDHPLGSEHGALTYDAQPFRVTRHLGDDLNGIGGQNSDLGDPVFAVGAGRVVLAQDVGGGWGNMVILAHRVRAQEKQPVAKVIQSVYAHLDEIKVRPGETVKRGDQIGSVGTGGGKYLAHLHFEIREGPYPGPGVGYADVPMNRVSPTRFLFENRGAPEDLLNPAARPEPVEVEVTRQPAMLKGRKVLQPEPDSPE